MSDDSESEHAGPEAFHQPQDERVQDGWENWHPSVDVPVISSSEGRVSSGWDHEELDRIYARMSGATHRWSSSPGGEPAQSVAPAPVQAFSGPNGSYESNGSNDGNDGNDGMHRDGDPADLMKDRGFLEFVLFQRACAERRQVAGLPAVVCERDSLCDNCKQHEGAVAHFVQWQTISESALEGYVNDYLQLRPTLPPWQSTRSSDLRAAEPETTHAVDAEERHPPARPFESP